jgi:hypothetical protein
MKAIAFMPNATIDERVAQLKKICHSESEETYNRTLTDSEIEREKTNYVDNGIRLKDVEVEAKASADSFNAKKTAIKKEMDEQLERVQNRSRKVYDTLYGVANPENGQMEFYDKFGELISSRGLTPDEFNGKLFDNEGEASAGAEPLGIGFEKPKPDIEDAEYEEVKNETQAESETEATETQETGKKPRKNSKRTKDKETD